MIQILIPPVPMPTDVRITLSVVLLGLIILGVIFIPKAMKYRKRLSETNEPEELEKDKTYDMGMMNVDNENTDIPDNSNGNVKE